MKILPATVPLLAMTLSLSLFITHFIEAGQANAASEAVASPAGSSGEAPALTITRNGAVPSAMAPAERFTGAARVDRLFQAPAPARVSGASVTFEPGARTAWHTHPLGQTLIVTSGVGRVQPWGGVVKEIRPGDVVWIPPGQKHWHGASPTTAMTHIAIAEALDGKTVDWLEKVSEAQYVTPP